MTNKTPIADRLKTLAEVAGSQAKLAAAARISEGTIINWSRGLGLRESKLQAASTNLGISLAWLRDGRGDSAEQLEALRERLRPSTLRENAPHEPHTALKYYRQREEDTYGARPKLVLPQGMTGRYVPLLSLAEAGPFDANHSDALYDYTAVFAPNVDDRRAFAIKVSGNSMEPDINDGDLVICSPASTVQNGEAAVVRTHSEQVFVKYWRQCGERVELVSANPDYDPIALPPTEILGAWPVVQRITSGRIQRKL